MYKIKKYLFCLCFCFFFKSHIWLCVVKEAMFIIVIGL